MGFLKSVSKLLGGEKVGGAIGAVAGTLLGGPSGGVAGYELGSTLGKSYQSDSDAKHQSRQAQELYSWQLGQQEASNIRLWNMQNEYNTPANQMLRFKEAGLNPNLIYGQTNTASPISTASADLNFADTPQGRKSALQQQDFNNYVSMANLGMQKTLNDAQAWNIYNTAKNRDREYDLQVRKLELEEKMLPLQIALSYSNLETQAYNRKSGHEKTVEGVENIASDIYRSLKSDFLGILHGVFD